ncbi:MAG: O-Antigen Polymerase family [uncultured bacterium]|nr:MAG: O-Antigen Polymerase family [uncultured bacterium]
MALINTWGYDVNYEKITNAFDLLSKICAVMTAAAIVLSTAATNILFFATVLFGLAAGNWRAKFDLIVRNPVAIIFLLFYVLFLVGALYSTAPWPDMLKMLRKYDKFLLAVFFIPLFTEERWRKYAINAFVAAILVMLVAAYLKDFGWLSHVAKRGSVEVFKPSIEFSFLMAFAGYLCLLRVVTDKRYRWLWVAFLSVVVYTLLFRSIGRTGQVVFVFLVTLFFIQKLGYRGLILAIISSALLLGAAYKFSPVFKERSERVFSDVKVFSQNENTSVGLRMSFVKNGLKLIKEHPVFGAGTGSFIHEYTNITPALVPELLTNNPHNEYVFIAVQFGALGLAMLLLLFGVPIWYSRLLPEELKHIVHGTVLGIMLGCLANSWLLDTTEGHFYAYFIALAFAALPTKNRIIAKTATTC